MSSEEEFSLTRSKIAIIGLGLMGGSLALALKGKCSFLFGVDPDQKTRNLALSQSIVDIVEDDFTKVVNQSDVIILCAPVQIIKKMIGELPDRQFSSCIVLDIGSSKVEVIKEMEKLPKNYDPIGGHPICGKEKLSIENADRTLFYGAPFITTPLERTSSRAKNAAAEIINAIGARQIELSAEEHDRILASTSHLPFLISSVLALSTELNVAGFIGPGFLSASRLAGTSSSMMLGVIMSNRTNLLNSLEKFQDELSIIISAISENDTESLESCLNSAREKYNLLINKVNK